MRKLLFVIAAALCLASCGQSDEEKAMTKAVHQKYKEEQIEADMAVPFNILNLSVKSRKASGDTVRYKVEFDIQEMHPSRRYYYEGHTEITQVKGGRYSVGHLYYHENSKLNR